MFVLLLVADVVEADVVELLVLEGEMEVLELEVVEGAGGKDKVTLSTAQN